MGKKREREKKYNVQKPWEAGKKIGKEKRKKTEKVQRKRKKIHV